MKKDNDEMHVPFDEVLDITPHYIFPDVPLLGIIVWWAEILADYFYIACYCNDAPLLLHLPPIYSN